MNSLPKTLSNEVAVYVKSWNSDASKLNSNPRLFMKFVQQANQDYTFVAKNVPLMITSYALLTNMAITAVLPLSEVIKTVVIISRFNKRVLVNNGDVSFSFEKEKFFCSRLFMLPHCSVLRKRWEKKPDESNFAIQEFLPVPCNPEYARLLITDYLPNLYLTFFEFPIGSFSRLDNHALFLLIKFCQSIGYIKAFNELQTIYCDRINNYKVAFEELVFARNNQMKIVEDYCRKYLEQLDVYKISRDGSEFYVLLSFVVDSRLIKGWIDLGTLTKGYLSYPYSILNNELCMFITQLYFINNQAAMVSCERSKIEEFTKIKGTVLTANPKKLKEFDQVGHLIFGGKSYVITSEIFASVCQFFDKVQTVALSSINEISETVVAKIAEAKPNLECFVFSELKVEVLPKHIELITKNCPRLSKIGFCSSNVSKDVFTTILITKQIVKIELANSTFELPLDLNLLSNLVQLELININKVSQNQISKLLSNAKNVRFLSLVHIKDHSFKNYPYPHNIVELSGFFENFYAEKEYLIKFVNLKSLIILNFNNFIFSLTPYLPQGAKILMGNLSYSR